MAQKTNINITMISDVICPWCWVAKRKMESAISLAGDKYNFKIHLEPFKLKPNIGIEGEAKPELPPGKPRVSDNLRTAGEAVGINFSGKGDRFPDTAPSHALMAWAEETGKHLELEEALYQAYFTDGTFLGEDALVEIAAGVGLDRDAARTAVKNTQAIEDANAKSRYWRGKLKGIPAFYMNGVEAFQGGREVEDFLSMFDVVAENYPQ